MRQEIDTIIFDLDGTIYQNTEFHRDYLHFLVEGTAREGWVDSLIAFADAVFVGERLVMNAFYDASRIEASTPAAYFAALERALLPELTYEEALARADCLYNGRRMGGSYADGADAGPAGQRQGGRGVPPHARQDERRRHDRLPAAQTRHPGAGGPLRNHIAEQFLREHGHGVFTTAGL